MAAAAGLGGKAALPAAEAVLAGILLGGENRGGLSKAAKAAAMLAGGLQAAACLMAVFLGKFPDGAVGKNRGGPLEEASETAEKHSIGIASAELKEAVGVAPEKQVELVLPERRPEEFRA